ncbi:MAG TPA: hypothetical protein VL551_32175 [Actinospica sp.]|nr:hypothetical protein [Actinospica sp.]
MVGTVGAVLAVGAVAPVLAVGAVAPVLAVAPVGAGVHSDAAGPSGRHTPSAAACSRPNADS